MVGREVLLRVDKPAATPRRRCCAVRGLSVTRGRTASRGVDGVSFEVRAGEIVGIAGVEGNGQTELVEALAGWSPPARVSGAIDARRPGHHRPRRPRSAASRHRPRARGPAPPRPAARFRALAENAILGVALPAAGGRPGPAACLARPGAHPRARPSMIRDFDVRPPNPELPARALSGGNQQKLIIGREFELRPKLLLVAQPTRGVDIGAIEFIHRQLVALRDAGCAMLLVSAELEEVTGALRPAAGHARRAGSPARSIPATATTGRDRPADDRRQRGSL